MIPKISDLNIGDWKVYKKHSYAWPCKACYRLQLGRKTVGEIILQSDDTVDVYATLLETEGSNSSIVDTNFNHTNYIHIWEDLMNSILTKLFKK